MSSTVLIIAFLLLMLVLEFPIAIALAVAGGLGLYLMGGFGLASSFLSTAFHEETASYVLIAIPMFVLMSQYLAHSGMARDIVYSGEQWLRKVRGGLGVACVLSSAMLAAVIGTSTAATATMSSAIYPSMKEVGYKPKFALGIIVVSGTLAIMIPPGLILILYGILTEESVGKLLIAGIFPGILTAVGYILTIMYVVWRNPDWVPAAKDFDRKAAMRSIKPVWPVFLLIGIVIFALYGGIATPSEIGALGAFFALAIVLVIRRLNKRRFIESLASTIKTTSMIIAILTGAMIFGYFLTFSQATNTLIGYIDSAGLSAWQVMAIVIVMYLVLGLFMDQLAVLVLTVPTTYALVSAYGFDGIWFGIIITKTVEIGLVTPPLGMNVFVASGVTGVKSSECFKGVVPFLVIDLVVLALLVAFPSLVLWIPNMSGL
ncbi:TRAP transporter large permease [Halomonas alimentaria]|uniref:TRAP transporter large permease n=1 Tax=Halomonas alimentaria TaxID=147248 RepID=UPI0024922ABE|nr:TRAP transporter large permease [Halomonas alimentaria]